MSIMRKIVRNPAHNVLFVVFAIAVAARVEAQTPSPASPATPIRVMTWNGQTQFHGSDEWARVVGNQAPDVVGMQEVCVREVKDLRDRLKEDYNLDYYVTYGSVRESRDPGCGTVPWVNSGAWGQAILTRTSLGSPRDAETVKYEKCDEEIDKVCPRGYQAVTITLPRGDGLRVFNTHIGLGPSAQSAQVRQLATEATRYSAAVILGDFNLEPKQNELAPLQRSFREVDPNGQYSTYPNDPDDSSKQPTKKIDYIFFSGVAQSSRPETYWTKSSDHRPLISSVR
jgi:endonuclease/exonuclease/phosphatase family metal-dependent hydrolase